MSIEIITIGREILDGRVIDTNSVFFGQELSKLGLVPKYFQRVDDIEKDIFDAFALAATRAKFVLVSGGLGPTSDDMTGEVFAKFVNKPWIDHAEAREEVRLAFARMNRPIIESQWKQGKLAEGASVLPNPNGTAPGFTYQSGATKWFFMPGVPREMMAMFRNHVLPHIPADLKFKKQMWMTQFTSEGELQQRLGDVIRALPPEISFFYRTRFPENHLGLSGSITTPALEAKFLAAAKQIDTLLGDDVYSTDEKFSLERIVGNLAVQAGVHLVTVESCTGGLIASRLTDAAGSSESFWGGFCTYDYDHKRWLAERVDLGEDMDRALDGFGAVSEETARVMAQCGALAYRSKSPGSKVLCVSTTGIAGPGGGTTQKPVGTCCFAISDGDQVLLSHRVQARIGLERDQLKLFFAQQALDLLRRELLKL